MAAFLYYIPGKKNVIGNDKQIPQECQLGNVLDGASFSSNKIQGPDNEIGTLLIVEPSPQTGGTTAQLKYDPVVQTWKPVENQEGKITHWIGWEIENPPTSKDLVRPKVTDGLALNLNGSPYLVPLATYPDTDITQLPQGFVWRKGGVIEEVKDRYADLCVRCKRQFDWICHKLGWEDIDVVDLIMHDYEQFYLCVDLLNVNYRVSGPEVCVLDLLDSVSVKYVIEYSLGFPYFEAEQRARSFVEAASEPPTTLPAT
jgi:hypothetical protein